MRTKRDRRRPRRVLALALLCCGGLAGQAGIAQAETLKFSFNDGRINLGDLKGQPMTDPAHPDMLGSLTGKIDPVSGNFTSPPGSLYVPPREVHGVSAGGYEVDAAVDFFAAGAFSGHYDNDTGALNVPSLDLTATLSVYPAGEGPDGLLLARCQVSPVPLPLTSSGSISDDSDPDAPITYSADPFDSDGASVSSWDSLPASTSVGGVAGPTVCPMVDDAAAGPGGLWMAGRATVVSDLAGVTARKCSAKRLKKSKGTGRKCPKKKKKRG